MPHSIHPIRAVQILAHPAVHVSCASPAGPALAISARIAHLSSVSGADGCVGVSMLLRGHYFFFFGPARIKCSNRDLLLVPCRTGLMTKTCSHTFHCHCLSNWGDSRCPICRYSESKLNKSSTPDQSECAACGSQANLWICLICGHVGCGRYQGGHAYRHFGESAHLYALELGSQRVWDYVGDK